MVLHSIVYHAQTGFQLLPVIWKYLHSKDSSGFNAIIFQWRQSSNNNIYLWEQNMCDTYSKISFSSIVFILLVFAFFNLQWENCHFQPWKLINWCGVLTHPFSSSKDKENRFKFPISISTSWCQNIWVTLKIMVPCWRLRFLY